MSRLICCLQFPSYYIGGDEMEPHVGVAIIHNAFSSNEELYKGQLRGRIMSRARTVRGIF